jgi:cellulose synthase/poly-beta-1,6-N-acetylglucosamine synthase-like glycosyltransferase/peptidoglycan/xylan/chitin deacetylase (PgdA/CDA1 family)
MPGRHYTGQEARLRQLQSRVERPPAHWSLLLLFVSVLVLALTVDGLATRTTPKTSIAAAPPSGPGRLLIEEHGRIVSRRPMGNEVTLAFEGGPDGTWTPRIARELHRLGVRATFFVVGSQVAKHPSVVRELHRLGHEVGSGGFTGRPLGGMPSWRRPLELSMSESAVAGAAGIRPRLFLPSGAGPLDRAALNEVARRGYVVALPGTESRDGAKPGVAAIVRNATPPNAAIVRLHDGGGDRSQTLEALPGVVRALRAEGLLPVTASRLAGLPVAAAQPRVSGSEQLRGELLLAALEGAHGVALVLLVLLLPLVLLAGVRTLAALALATRRGSDPAAEDRAFEPSVSVIVPAHNEHRCIAHTVQALVASDYRELEVIVVDDGSTDGTGFIVERLDLEGVRVLRQANCGKAAALNTGVAAAAGELVVCVDADTLVPPDSLRRLVAPLRDPSVGAVAGNPRVGNRRSSIGLWQHIEYVAGPGFDRRVCRALGATVLVPGAAAAFRREALDSAGGFSADTLAEDADVSMAIGRAGWQVEYADGARAYTEAPASLAALWRQRYRWSFGVLQAVWKHRSAPFRRGQGAVGRRTIPYVVLFQLALPLLAPLADLVALYCAVFVAPLPTALAWIAFNFLLIAQALMAFRLDGEQPGPLRELPVHQLVYRQLMYLVVLQALASALIGARLRWYRADRRGDAELALQDR